MIYENAINREDQDFLHWMLEYVGFSVEGTDTLCPWDFDVYRDNTLHALVEYKARDKFYDPIFLSKHKADTIIDASAERSVQPVFIIGSPGPPYYHTTLHKNHEVDTFKRQKDSELRNDREEAVYRIPKSAFKLL